MSSRQLRKLQQQRELEQAQAKLQEQEQEDESEEEPVVAPKSKASLFANLASLEDEDTDRDQDEEESMGKEDLEETKEMSDPAPTTTAKKSKKSKGKKKGKNKSKTQKSPQNPQTDTEDVDAILRELALEEKASGKTSNVWTPTVDPEYERVCKLLGINTQHLKVANEMRNLFGKTAVDNHDDAGGRVGRNARRQRAAQQVDLETALKGHHAPGKGLSELTLRRNAFIQGKDDWPRGTTGGLTMEVVDSRNEDGTVEFRYVHDKTYQELQRTFKGFVEMGDPQNLIALLTRNPYHISLLIQVSKIAKDQTDHALSSDLLERALFSFGRAASSQFNTKISQGKARLDFSRPENRELWLAGYQYIKSLVMKGTYRTALEWAKFLLSLDPEGDPYCMRLVVHHLSLRAHEFNWLLDVSESTIPKIWSPSGFGESQSQAATHTTPSLAFAALQLREQKQTRSLLNASMKRVPWLFTRLFKELSLDAPPSIWGVLPRTEAETLFTEVYVLQTKDLWNTPEATALLMETAYTVGTINLDAIPKLNDKEMTLDAVRFVYLDNTPALMALAPSHLLHRENNSDSDPLPPDRNIYSYETQRAWIERNRTSEGLGGDFLDPLAALARLIPGFGRNNEGAAADDEDERAHRLRSELEDAAREGRESEDGASEDQPTLPRSVAQRLLDMLGWGGGPIQESDSDEEEFYEEFEETSAEDDDEMPDLLPMDDGTDDEMPPLVAL